MAGVTNLIAQAIETQAAAVANVAGHSSLPVDAIPQTPFVYVGGPRIRFVPGSWDQRLYLFPMHYMIARIGNESIEQSAINDANDLMVAGFRNGVNLGSFNAALSGAIGWLIAADTDKFYTLNATEYQSIDYDVSVEFYSAQTYT